MLRRRHTHPEAVEFGRHAQLAGQPAGGFGLDREVQHGLFHLGFGREFPRPFPLDLNMAGGAGTGAPAIGVDAGDVGAHRAFHHRPAGLNLHRLFRAVGLNERNFRHQPKLFMGIDRSASLSGAMRALAAISFFPIMYSGAALMASTAATMPSRRWNTANLRNETSPRTATVSAGRAKPAI